MTGVALDARIVGIVRAIEEQVSAVVLGKRAQVRLACASLLAGEHLLLNDLPGVGKTTLATALATVVGGSFGRVQGTPDLLPTDLTGSAIYRQSDEEWVFRPGPLLRNVVLVDEINRVTPRTQSALLEAMAEGGVTVDGETRALPDPFVVIATMNPAGTAGTFPLMASQLDRFGVTVGMGSLDRPTERQLLRGTGGKVALGDVEPVIPVEFLPHLQAIVAEIEVADPLLDYVLDICDHLRSVGHLSNRASRSMLALTRAWAMLDGRCYAVPDDVQFLAPFALAHRIAAEGEPVDARCGDVQRVLASVPVPPAGR